MDYDVRLEQSPGRPLAVVRRRAKQEELPRVVPEACGAVWNAVRAHQIPNPGRLVALYWDCEINLDVGVELDTPFAGADDLLGASLPAGPVATAVHLGPYGRLGEAHRAIHKWCSEHQHALAGPNWEVYGHWVDEWNSDPSKIRTDVFYLLKPGGGS